MVGRGRSFSSPPTRCSGELRGLASKLPKGRVFASGKAFVQFVTRILHTQIEASGGEESKTPTGVAPVAAPVRTEMPGIKDLVTDADAGETYASHGVSLQA